MGAQTPKRQAVNAALQAAGLRILGGLHEGGATLLLIGPNGNHFWPIFQNSAEFQDGTPDPVDRYSTRTLNAIAEQLGAVAIFPFGGPPYQPFFTWAVATGRCFQSPVQLLVHTELGLFTSFRGALKFEAELPLPPVETTPCDTCVGHPCVNACPASALTSENYDVAACHTFLDSEAGANCITRGCAVRRSCPIGQDKRPEAQSAFHMGYFHKGATT